MSAGASRPGGDTSPVKADPQASVLESFCAEQGIDPAEFRVDESFLKRYVRLVPHEEREQTASAMTDRLGARRVRWLGDFLALPLETPLAAQPEYRASRALGMDAASGAAVRVLAPRPGDHVLDLCCAAGAKMAYIAHELGGSGSVTGVDAAAHRMDITVQRLKRAGVLRPAAGARVRLFVGDGRRFTLPPPAAGVAGAAVVEEHPAFALAADSADAADPLLLPARRRRGKRGRREREDASKRRRAALEGRAEEAEAAWRARPRYDRVLVDAPCTHDASLRHVAKAQAGEGLEAKALHPAYVASLARTQQELLLHGFDMLRPGGRLVYATCSFARAQNEDVVAHLLARRPDADLRPALAPDGSFAAAHGAERGPAPAPGAAVADAGVVHPSEGPRVPAVEGVLPGTIRFVPRVSGTSGLFIARIEKRDGGAGVSAPSVRGHS